MTPCETCGNPYDKPIQVTVGADIHVFDCFECAIHRLAPRCRNCACPIIGHGVEADGSFFCSAHCAAQKGLVGIRDRL